MRYNVLSKGCINKKELSRLKSLKQINHYDKLENRKLEFTDRFEISKLIAYNFLKKK